MAKKKKRAAAEAEAEEAPGLNEENRNKVKSEKRSANGVESDEKKRKKKKNKEVERELNPVQSKQIRTVSIALPGSIIDNAQSLELATRLAGQVARAATIFRIDEVVVFDGKISSEDDGSSVLTEENMSSSEDESGSAFLIRILRYLETPQYLRKSLFPKHNSLRFVGLLPPLDAPHHLRKHEWSPYREGITIKDHAANSSRTLVDVGLSKNVVINQSLEPGRRVTVYMGINRCLDAEVPRQIVPSSLPKEESEMYWGYRVRYAANLSAVFKNCPYKDGYDHLIGTSEHGLIIRSAELVIPPFRHLLIAFGGLAGLEECIEEDSNLKGKNAPEVFDQYLNTCPHQGSRTIRTEEAVFISLQYFQEPINRIS